MVSDRDRSAKKLTEDKTQELADELVEQLKSKLDELTTQHGIKRRSVMSETTLTKFGTLMLRTKDWGTEVWHFYNEQWMSVAHYRTFGPALFNVFRNFKASCGYFEGFPAKMSAADLKEFNKLCDEDEESEEEDESSSSESDVVVVTKKKKPSGKKSPASSATKKKAPAPKAKAAPAAATGAKRKRNDKTPAKVTPKGKKAQVAVKTPPTTNPKANAKKAIKKEPPATKKSRTVKPEPVVKEEPLGDNDTTSAPPPLNKANNASRKPKHGSVWVVGVGGGSGCGKSTVCHALHKAYYPKGGDWDYILNLVMFRQQEMEDKYKTSERPEIYNVEKCLSELDNKIRMAARYNKPVVFVEGFLLFAYPQIAERIDIALMLWAQPETRACLRFLREIRHGDDGRRLDDEEKIKEQARKRHDHAHWRLAKVPREELNKRAAVFEVNKNIVKPIMIKQLWSTEEGSSKLGWNIETYKEIVDTFYQGYRRWYLLEVDHYFNMYWPLQCENAKKYTYQIWRTNCGGISREKRVLQQSCITLIEQFVGPIPLHSSSDDDCDDESEDDSSSEVSYEEDEDEEESYSDDAY